MTSTLKTTTLGASAALALSATMAMAGDNKPSPNMMSGSEIHGADVSNQVDRNLADIQHLVVDTTSGRVAYAVIDTNNAMNLGDKLIAVPYGALSWHEGQKQFTINATQEQLRSLPPYDPQNLQNLNNDSWLSSLQAVFGEQDDLSQTSDDMYRDEYTSFFEAQKTQTMKGEVDRVMTKATTVRGNECFSIALNRDGANESVTVYLAPESYLKQEMIVPQPGQKVTVQAVKGYDSKGQVVYVARKMTLGEKSLELRNNDGKVRWSKRDHQASHPTYVLSTDLDNGDLYGAGEKFGDVNEIVYEIHSGTAACVIVSVGGLAGLGDTLYPIPYDVVTFGENSNLYVDMSTSELKLAPKLSADGIKDLQNETFYQRTCEYFDVDDTQFDTDRSSEWTAQVASHPGSGR